MLLSSDQQPGQKYNVIRLILHSITVISLIPRLPRFGIWILKLCRYEKPGIFLTWAPPKVERGVRKTSITCGRTQRLKTWKRAKVAGNLLHVSGYRVRRGGENINVKCILGWTTHKTLPFCSKAAVPILIMSCSHDKNNTRLSPCIHIHVLESLVHSDPINSSSLIPGTLNLVWEWDCNTDSYLECTIPVVLAQGINRVPEHGRSGNKATCTGRFYAGLLCWRSKLA